MTIQDLGSVGEFIAALATLGTLAYLAIQIRQNTKAIRSSSYHQAAEQTWNVCLTLAQDPTLADLYVRRATGGELTPTEQMRMATADAAMLFGFENMLRLWEEGLLDQEVWENVIQNSIPYLGSDSIREFITHRPGPLSTKLLHEIENHLDLLPSEGSPIGKVF